MKRVAAPRWLASPARTLVPAMLAASGVVLGCPGLAAGAEPPAKPAAGALADLDIDQLVNLTVTSVGKKEQSIASAPAAIYVLTQEDIHRTGAALTLGVPVAAACQKEAA